MRKSSLSLYGKETKKLYKKVKNILVGHDTLTKIFAKIMGNFRRKTKIFYIFLSTS